MNSLPERNHCGPLPDLYTKLSVEGGLIGSGLAITALGIDASLAVIQNNPFPPEHVLAFPPILAVATWGGIVVPALYQRAIEMATEIDERVRATETRITENSHHTGVTIKNAHHLLLLTLPNIFHPRKLLDDLKHPIYEFLHSKHNQYLVEGESDIYVVEHELFGKLVTVDVVRRDRFRYGLLLRIKQLFDRRFYYGHTQYFPEAFRLIKRTYVVDPSSFNINSHVSQILKSPVFDK